MKKRLITSLLLAITLITTFPISASAEWKQDSKGWWWYRGVSSWATGWTEISGEWYYFGNDGYMATGWQEIDGKKYYFGNDGYMTKGISEIGNNVYNFAQTGELLQSEDLEGDFEVKKEWFYWDDKYTETGHSNPQTDTPYSVTIKVPKKLYYDTLISTKDQKGNSRIQEQLVKRTDDIDVFKTFISEVMNLADENNIPEDERVNFLLTATLKSADLKCDIYSERIKDIEINPLKYDSIKGSWKDGLTTYKANGRQITIPEEYRYFWGNPLVYRKTPIESFVEGCGSGVDASMLSAKICSLYGLDSVILESKKPSFGTSGSTFVSGCRFSTDTKRAMSDQYTDIIQYNGKSYGDISDNFGKGGVVDVARNSGADFSKLEEFNLYPVPKIN